MLGRHLRDSCMLIGGRFFDNWCQGRGLDPVRCPVASILEFLQGLFDQGRSPSTLKVYVAAISCWHHGINGCSVGTDRTVSSFLKGARRLRPPTRPVAPPWDLTLVLDALRAPPFEPLDQVGLKWLSLKTAFLLAMASGKRVSELQALSVHESCCRWNPDGSGVALWPDASFLPKVSTSASGARPLQLARFGPAASAEPLCPVRALEVYIRATAGIHKSDCLFVCFGGP